MPSIKRKICSIHGIYTTKECELCKKEKAKSYNDTARDKESAKIYNSTRWRKIRKYILKRDGGICQICGRSEKSMIVDHIKEIKDGGEPYSYDNLQTLCKSCHNIKTAREVANRLQS